ncbi:MAG: PP2C family protein-serine/threonine phosphatase [Thermoleophilaceae bacterium]
MRPDERRDVQIVAIVASLGAILLLRLTLMPDPGSVELLPVLAAAWWFGTRAALVAGVAASAVLVAAALFADPFEPWTLVVRIPLVMVPAWLLGQLRDERERRIAELGRLRVIQDALAPVQAPDLPLLEVATRYVPAERGVAGDFYLVAPGHNNSTVVVVGDVVGKGIDAAKRATFARATLSACAPYSDNPVHLLRVTNAELIRQHGVSAEFITMVCVVVRPDSSLVWASAGHPPPLSLTDGQPIGTFKPSYPLGIAPELPVVGYHARLPQAGILLYTDGVTDARPRRQSYEPFGRVRLTRLIDELNRPTPDEAVERVVEAARVFSRGRLPDDVCLVALRSKLSPAWTSTMAERVEAVAHPPAVAEPMAAPEPARESQAAPAR